MAQVEPLLHTCKPTHERAVAALSLPVLLPWLIIIIIIILLYLGGFSPCFCLTLNELPGVPEVSPGLQQRVLPAPQIRAPCRGQSLPGTTVIPTSAEHSGNLGFPCTFPCPTHPSHEFPPTREVLDFTRDITKSFPILHPTKTPPSPVPAPRDKGTAHPRRCCSSGQSQDD